MRTDFLHDTAVFVATDQKVNWNVFKLLRGPVYWCHQFGGFPDRPVVQRIGECLDFWSEGEETLARVRFFNDAKGREVAAMTELLRREPLTAADAELPPDEDEDEVRDRDTVGGRYYAQTGVDWNSIPPR